MTLAFSTHWNNKMEELVNTKTMFPEKIWQSLMQQVGLDDETYYKWHDEDGILNLNIGNNYDDSLFDINPKIHAILQDSKNRWKAGNLIHPVINNRTPQRFQFAPTIQCVSIQTIDIVYLFNEGEIPTVLVDGKSLAHDDIEELAINDGFTSIEHFFMWFDTDLQDGKIIHWTDKKY